MKADVKTDNGCLSIRIPHEGQNFKLCDCVFVVSKSCGFRIEACTDIDYKNSMPNINVGNTFKLMGTRFKLIDMKHKIRNKTIKIFIKAHVE